MTKKTDDDGGFFGGIADLLGDVAPAIAGTLATAATGNPLLGAAAGKALARAIGVDEKSSPQQLAEAVRGMPPGELKLAARKAEQAYLVRLRGLEVQEVEAHAKDRQSARKMRTETRSKLADGIGLVAIAGLVALACVSVFWRIPTANVSTFNLIVGAVIGYAGSVFTFYFGSSVGSRAKENIIADHLKGGPPNV